MTADEFVAWRKEAGASQSEAAELLGVSRTTVARWEAGERVIPDTVPVQIGLVSGPEKLAPVEPRAVVEGVVDTKGFDPVAAGLRPGPTTNTVWGASADWGTRPPGPGWQRVSGGIRVVHGSIPNPINYIAPEWAGWRGVVTADGRVFDHETGHEMHDYNERVAGKAVGGFIPNWQREKNAIERPERKKR